MRPLCSLALAAGLLIVTTGPTAGGDPPPALPAEQRDPQDVFRKACDRLVTLEAKNDLRKGVSEIKPVVEQDDKKRLKSAQFVFGRNAPPPGKGPAKPKDEAKPFVYVSVQVWAGRSQPPPADLHEFRVEGSNLPDVGSGVRQRRRSRQGDPQGRGRNAA